MRYACVTLLLLTRAAFGGISLGSDTVFAPPPPYPYEAKANGLEGRGVFVMDINRKTGTVSAVSIEKSTGVRMLDEAAIQGFSRWKFKVPLRIKGTTVRCPIEYSLPESTKAILRRRAKHAAVSSNQALQPTASPRENCRMTNSTFNYVMELAAISGG